MKRNVSHRRALGIYASSMFALTVFVLTMVGAMVTASAQKKEIVWSAAEKPLAEAIRGLRGRADDVRAQATKDLALKIRQLPATENKLQLAVGLAGRSTEGDFGHDTLQEVATTLAGTLRERPAPWPEEKPAEGGQTAAGTSTPGGEGAQPSQNGAAREPAYPYLELATLVRYEHVEAALDNPQFGAALARLEADDRKREHPRVHAAGLGWQGVDVRGVAGQGGAGELLGDVVSAVPEGDAGPGDAL